MCGKSNIRFFVKSNNHADCIFTIYSSPGVIENIIFNILAFSKKHPEYRIHKNSNGFELDAKAYRAIQDIIYQEIN